MSLLTAFPHRCTKQLLERTKGSLMGSSDSAVVEQTGIHCWEQPASHAEILDYQQRGIVVNRKVYFLEDHGFTARHQIVVTSRLGVAVADPVAMDVKSKALPDSSAGMGVVWKVMAEEVTSKGN